MSLRRKIWGFIKLTRPEIADEDLSIPAAVAILAIFLGWGGFRSDFPTPLDWFLATIGAYFATVSSYVLNDVKDWDIDSINLPYRPIPSGAVTRLEAAIFGLALLGAAFAIAYYFNIWTVLALIFAATTINFYSYVAKRSTPFSFIFVGLAWGTMAFGVWLAINGRHDPVYIHPAAVMIALMFMITDWGFTLSGVCRDVEGDRARGAPTFPVTYGIPATSRMITAFWTIGVILSLAIWYAARLGPLYLLGALLGGAWELSNCLDFVRNPLPERGGKLFLQSSRYRFVIMGSMLIDVLLCMYLPGYRSLIWARG